MMRLRCLLAVLLAAAVLPSATAQTLDELYRRMQAGDEEARREYWTRKKGTMREIFEQAYQGTLDETTPAGGSGTSPDASGTPAADDRTGPSMAELANALKLSVVALFNAYEQESIGGFLALVDASFAARDRNGTDYRQSDLPRVLSDDFAILERIAFTVQVEQPAIQSDGKRAQVEVTWSRRAWVQTGGQEWILLDQRSTFQFEAGAGGQFLLAAIFGDPIFAIARPQGHIVVTEGTIDGKTVTDPVTLDRNVGIVVVQNPTEQPAAVAPTPSSPPSATVLTKQELVKLSRLDLDSQTKSDVCDALAGADIDFSCGQFGTITVQNGAQILALKSLFPGGFNSVTELPQPPYGADPISLTSSASDVGELYAIRTSEGKFAILAIVGFQPGEPPIYAIVYKVQTNGSRQFLP